MVSSEQRSNEIINGQQFYGSVRLFHRFSDVPERGRFRCELPNTANPSTDLTIHVNVCEFVKLVIINNIIFPLFPQRISGSVLMLII